MRLVLTCFCFRRMVSAVIGFLLGVSLGSFAKATADRVIAGKSLRGRSYCWSCKRRLKWYDLFPVLSYISLRGRCRFCHKRIPPQLFISEIAMGVLVALVFWTALLPYPDFLLLPYWEMGLIGFEVLFKVFIVCVMFIVFWTDLQGGLIFDRVMYPALEAAAIFWVVLSALRSASLYYQLQGSLIGRFLLPPHTDYLYQHLKSIWMLPVESLLAGVLAALFFIILILVTRGRGMGWGDVKYVLFLGLALGFPNIIVGLILSFVFGSVASLVLIVMKRRHFGQTIPFGPFLSMGAYVALLYGQQIMDWYLKAF